MSEFGGRADVQQIRVIAPVMITVLPESANYGPLAQTKTATEVAVYVDIVLVIMLLSFALPCQPVQSALIQTATPQPVPGSR